MRLAVVATALLPTILATLTRAQCKVSAATPVDPAVVGKTVTSVGGCSPGGQQTGTLMRIESWGIFWEGFSGPFGGNFPVCGEQIVVLFSKSDKPAKVLNRPGKPAAHFKDSHPKIYVKFLNNEFPKFPCDTIKVETVNVWGPQRARFKSLVASMASGAKDLRDLDCAAEYGGPNRPITVQGLERYLAKHIVANNALSYLYNLAYSNFFCV